MSKKNKTVFRCPEYGKCEIRCNHKQGKVRIKEGGRTRLTDCDLYNTLKRDYQSREEENETNSY